MGVALIELVGANDELAISGDLDEIDANGIALATSPSGLFGTPFTARTIAAPIGGREGGVEIPVLQVTLVLDIFDVGDGVASAVSRVRRLFGSMFNRHKVRLNYTSDLSGKRWLVTKLEREIEFTPEQDWEETGEAQARITLNAIEPRYESQAQIVLAENPSSGENTVWVPVWNPTDQPAWLSFSLMPKTGPCEFSWPDFSFGQEQSIDLSWDVNEYDDRMISTPGAISVNWSVMSDRQKDKYVAADLSNISGQMGGVYPLFPIPPYTGTPEDPILLPIIFDGPAGAQVEVEIRRLWSAESGLEAPEPEPEEP